MNIREKSSIRTGSGADLAFAVVVLTAYFVTFSSLKSATRLEILAMISLGITYIATGIYGYAFCAKKGRDDLSILYFLVQAILGGSIVYLSKGAGLYLLILLPLAGHSVILLSSYRVYAVNAFLLLVYSLVIYTFFGSWEKVIENLPNFLAGQVFIIAFIQMAVNEEKARVEVEKLVKDLENANQALREYAAQVEELTLAKERNRMAREIHDGLGHYLTTVNMQIQAALAVIEKDKKQAAKTLASAQRLTKEALVEIRRSVSDLRETEEVEPLSTRVEKLINVMGALKISPSYLVLGEPRPLKPAVELALYRVAQEGLSNIYKHAGATEVWVQLDYSQPDQIVLEIKDNGSGGMLYDEGWGLRGLQERVNLLNGKIEIESSLGQGFKIVVSIPA